LLTSADPGRWLVSVFQIVVLNNHAHVFTFSLMLSSI
jgi:hypothetical protein